MSLCRVCIPARTLTTAALRARGNSWARLAGLRPATVLPDVCVHRNLQSSRCHAKEPQKSEAGPSEESKHLSKPQQEHKAVSRRRQPGLGPVPAFGRLNRYIDEMQREMDDLMDKFWPDLTTGNIMAPFQALDFPALPTPAAMLPAARQLMFEVEDTEKEILLHAEVPGFTKDDLKVTISPDNVLTVKGEKQEETSDEGKSKGRIYRSYYRQLRLPKDVDVEKISAETKHGMLTIALPKVEHPEAKGKEIPVHSRD